MDQMTTNLQQELVSFRERIKSEGVVKLVQRDGTGGGGAAGQLEILVLAALLASVAHLRRRARNQVAKVIRP
jgi:rhombotail lipoprotein